MEQWIAIGSIFVLLLGYFVSLERQLSEIKTDIKWIKEYINKCQQP